MSEIKKVAGVFYFNFRFEGEEDNDGNIPKTNWAFTFNEKAVEKLGENFPTGDEEWFEEAFWDIEAQFGVHDWATAPVNNILGIGYTTYEMSRKDARECIERWHQEFINKLGSENVSESCLEIGEKDIIDDMDAFQRFQKITLKKK